MAQVRTIDTIDAAGNGTNVSIITKQTQAGLVIGAAFLGIFMLVVVGSIAISLLLRGLGGGGNQ